MSLKHVVLAAVLTTGAASAHADRRKPSAPVTLAAAVQRTGAGWQVVVDAAPTRDVGSVEVEVAGQTTRFGSTAARRARRVVVPVAVAPGAGQDVLVVARVGGRSKVTTVRVGAPAPAVAKRAATLRVVNGVTISEVR